VTASDGGYSRSWHTNVDGYGAELLDGEQLVADPAAIADMR